MPITKPSITSIHVVVSDHSAVADDAMRLAHDGLVDSGFMRPAPSGRRFAAPYLNPGTRFMVSYVDAEPVGAAILVEDGPFGLPSDRAFGEDIDALRASVDTITEVSGLAIAKHWRNRARLLLGYLIGTVVRLNGPRGEGHRVTFAVQPRQAAFMSQILMGELTFGPRNMMGAPGTLIITADVSTWVEYFTDPNAPRPRRLVADYALEPNPDWLECHPPSGQWRREVLPPLLEESGIESKLRSKVEILQSSGHRSVIDASMALTV